MAEYTVIARPYAKAAFEIALHAEQLNQWAVFLASAALVANDERVRRFLSNPNTTKDQHLALFADVCAAVMIDNCDNFLKLLAENHRLHLLSAISKVFHELYVEYERTVEVMVTSAMPLSSDHQERLSKALQIRLQKQVSLQTEVDPNLLGGAIIRAGDKVIDGSVMGRLKQLSTSLTGSYSGAS